MIKQELISLIAIQLADNKKAVALNQQMQNIHIKPVNGQPAIRSQEAIYNLMKV